MTACPRCASWLSSTGTPRTSTTMRAARDRDDTGESIEVILRARHLCPAEGAVHGHRGGDPDREPGVGEPERTGPALPGQAEGTEAEQRRREQRAREVVDAEGRRVPVVCGAPGHRRAGGCERDEPCRPGVAPSARERAGEA